MRFLRLLVLVVTSGLAASCFDVDDRTPVDSENNASSSLKPATNPGQGGAPCAPGASRCASGTERSECTSEGSWGEAIACLYLCSDGQCAAECAPGSTECVSATRVRTCSAAG